MLKVRKQYSLKYQVVELEQEVDSFNEADVVGGLMDGFAKEELKRMVEVVESLGGNDTPKASTSSVASVKQGSLTEKQEQTIKKNFDKCKGFASELGITLNYPSDVSSLEKKQANEILNKLFGK